MSFLRRDFLKISGRAIVAGVAPSCLIEGNERDEANNKPVSEATLSASFPTLENIRESFLLDPEYIHLGCLLLAAHPKHVRIAIEKYRTSLDKNPVIYVQENFSQRPQELRKEAAKYMNVAADEIGITNCTTMGTGLIINGIHIRPDQEMLTADLDYYSTHQAIQYKSFRTGATYRKFPLYKNIQKVTVDEILENVFDQIRPETRVLTGTWVHSSTGLKLPVQEISSRLKEINADREKNDKILFFLDGVHGFGVEETAVGDLGCDLFSAGTHKWMFAPRGTGILWGRREIHDQVTPTIPTFTNEAGWGGSMTPGGFKPFEHEWAMTEAFRFHSNLGKEKIANHIHQLAQMLKEGLSEMNHITLHTPMDPGLSSGIVCFEVDGLNPKTVVEKLHRKKIIATDTPYAVSYARFTPGIYNTMEEMEIVLKAVEDLK